MKKLLENVFYQLIFIYTVFILLIALGFLGKYALQFHILGFLIGIVGVIILFNVDEKEKKIDKRIFYILFLIGFLIILFLRIVPYINSDIPLGYDTGMYKYGIEKGLENGDEWIRAGMEPGFLYLMEPLKSIFEINMILTIIFIIFNAILGLAIYVCAREYFGNRAAIISLLLYGLSVVQFKVFTYMYYKNIIGLSLMLFSLYVLKKGENKYGKEKIAYLISFVLFAAILGAVHRPTFYIFGLSYFLYSFISPIKKKYDYRMLLSNIIIGILIVSIAFIFYLHGFMLAITQILPYVGKSFISPGDSPGTFISFFQYQFLVLAYIPFAVIGFAILLKKRKIDMLSLWIIINFFIVYFQFFFFNRFIIHLDIALIVVSGVGMSRFIDNRKKTGYFIVILIILSLLMLSYKESSSAKSPILESELENIKKIDIYTEKNASIMVLSSEYSPWVLGYSKRKVIAPGLFDENKWSEEEWNMFWNSNNSEQTKEMISVYSKPLYMFSGTKKFNNPCFDLLLDNKMLYKYRC